jgi:nitrite reductase (cytochrome c-552)
MKEVLRNIRHSQWRWDFAAASHGASFHAPLEVARMLSTGIDKAAEARRLLAKILAIHNVKTPISMPDISTKDKAQKYIGLDMAKLNADKKDFMRNILPQWDKMTVKRENK